MGLGQLCWQLVGVEVTHHPSREQDSRGDMLLPQCAGGALSVQLFFGRHCHPGIFKGI